MAVQAVKTKSARCGLREGYGDFDVVAEGGEEFHEAGDAEIAGAIARRRKDSHGMANEKDEERFHRSQKA